MTELNIDSKITLNNGVQMPRLGLGVWKSDNQTAEDAVFTGIRDGYILIDTAKQYGNETGVGRGIKRALEAADINREDLFITTKIYNGDQGYESTLKKIDGQLRRLQLDYVDLLLIHWPVDATYLDTWHALEEIYKAGKTRAIGVSNFDVERLNDLITNSDVVPAVNQIEFNPLIHQEEVLKFHKQHGIQTEAWSPLGGGKALGNPVIEEISARVGKSVAQVIIRWGLQHDVVTIPKSAHEKRIIENSQVFDLELSTADMHKIDALNEEHHSLWYDDFAWHGNPNGFTDSVDQWPDSPADYDA